MFQDFCYSDTTHLSRSRSVKVKEFQERCNIKAFQERYEHVGPEVTSPQVGKVSRWQRDCLVDDAQELKIKNNDPNTSSRNKLNPQEVQ
ncbi:hypothetical protein Tco_1447390 [Tanacetum coccineum]